MKRGDAESAVETAIADWPNLTCWGFAHARSEGFSEARAQLRSEGVSYFLRAAEWLSHIPRRKTPNLGSYFLKHQAERWTGDYVSNGALIAAAIHLGFKIEPIHGTPNALINVAERAKWPAGYYTDDQPSRGGTAEDGQRIGYHSTMHSPFFEALVEELSKVSRLEDLPEWIPCTDSDILRDLATAAERRRWLRKAKAEITRRAIQERIDEIAEAWEDKDDCLDVLMEAFPEDLKLHQKLTPAQRQMWLDKAALAACGRGDEIAAREPVIYFIGAGDDLIKIGHTTNLRSRLRSLRTAHPNELRLLLVIPGSRDDEQDLHRRFA